MHLKVMILIVLILISLEAAALNFDEKIKVNGNGYMLSRTNTVQSSDLAEGHGTQTYHRVLSSKLGVSSLTSEYNLKSNNFINNHNYSYSLIFDNKTLSDNNIYGTYNLMNSAYFPNRYSINMRSPTGLSQTISVFGLSGEGVGDLNSSSSITFTPIETQPSPLPTSDYTVFTSFNINGNGTSSEAVTDSSLGKHPLNIAETSVFGNFSVNSRLTDDLTLPGSEAQDLSSKVDDVIPVSGMPQQTNSSVAITDLESMLKQGLITQDDYLNKMQDLLKTGRINADEYATRLTSAFNSGLITLSYEDYSALLHKATSGTLDNLNAMVNQTLITPEEYLTKLKQMLDGNRLTEVEYLGAIKATSTTTKVNSDQFSVYKNDALNEMGSKFANGVIDWPTYFSRLNVMLNFGLINKTDYDSQIQATSNETISNLEQMFSSDPKLINETDFACKLKEMKDEARINETVYDQELSKFNLSKFDVSRCLKG